jgi:mono/diheme cytochrome c family protein
MSRLRNRLTWVGLGAAALVCLMGMAPDASTGPPPPVAPSAPSPDRGHALVMRDCARCHSVEATGASRFRPAPPFRTLHSQYPLDSLEEALAEGIISGHPAMPEFEYSASDVADIIAWMKSLDER